MRKRDLIITFNALPFSVRTVIGLVCGVSAFQLLQQYAYHLTSGFDFEFSWLAISVKLFISNGVWALLSPLLLNISRRLTKLNSFLVGYSVVQLLVVLSIAFSQSVIALWLYNASYYIQSGYMRSFLGGNNRTDLVTGFFTSLIEAVVIIGFFMAIEYQRKLANKERDLAKARLDAIKMQLHPHFLFNTLHSISSMIDIDVKRAQKTITKVGDLLRVMLSRDQDDFGTLKHEIDYIRNYLELEQIRFQDRMLVTFDIGEGLTECKIPSLILQPLVENCIKHGVSKSRGESKISVSAMKYNNGTAEPWLKLEIQNSDDTELISNGESSFGIGLQNVERRLVQNYKDQFFFEFKRIDTRHYKSEIRIPLNI